MSLTARFDKIFEKVMVSRFVTPRIRTSSMYFPNASRIKYSIETGDVEVFPDDANAEPLFSTRAMEDQLKRMREDNPGNAEVEAAMDEAIKRVMHMRDGYKLTWAAIRFKLFQVDTCLGYPVDRNEYYNFTITLEHGIPGAIIDFLQYVGGMGPRILESIRTVCSDYLSEEQVSKSAWIFTAKPGAGDMLCNQILERREESKKSSTSAAA